MFENCFVNPFDHIYTSHLEFENFVNYVEGMIDLYYLKCLQKFFKLQKSSNIENFSHNFENIGNVMLDEIREINFVLQTKLIVWVWYGKTNW